MTAAATDFRPGFRRRIVVSAQAGAALAMLEDDIHCLSVTLRHDGERVKGIEPLFERAPWTTCPGALARLTQTFAGQLLSDVTARREKKQNCTHLHDMAVLAAAHAGDRGRITYDMLATDPRNGERILEIRRDGAAVHRWVERGGKLVEPAELAGQKLSTLRDWISSLGEPEQEAARLLQWAAIVAHGRTLPFEHQSNASDMQLNCYTFQPERVADAIRNDDRRDFSDASLVPLAGFGDRVLAELRGNR